MPSSYTLGKHFEDFVQAQLASGRYNNASEVIRDALRLLEERQRRLAAFDAVIERSLADSDAGRVHDAETVFDDLEAKYSRMVEELDGPWELFFQVRPRRNSMKSLITLQKVMHVRH